MKLYEIINAVPALRKLGEQELSVRSLYSVSRILRKVDENLSFYNRELQKLHEKYCENHDGRMKPLPDFKAEFDKKYAELVGLEVDMDGMNRAKIAAEENIRLSYNDLMALEPFVEIEFSE